MNILADELRCRYPQIYPMEFYREIFPLGALDEWRDCPEERAGHAYTGIIVELCPGTNGGKPLVKRHTVTDDLDTIDSVIWGNNFCIMAPISYVGKARLSRNARFLYALVIELDNLIVRKNGNQDGLQRLINQWSERVHWIPQPTYLVASGNGLHLYYVFEQPVPLFPNVVKELTAMKRALTEKIWNRHVTTSCTADTIQYESLFQGFRMVGTVTKAGDRTQAFEIGDRVTLEYLNKYVKEPSRVTEIYKSKLSKADARVKYPEWYERRIVRGEGKGRWTCNRAVYDWWKGRIEEEAVVGHRYYCLMMLAVYAIKCEIDLEELQADCLAMMEIFEERTDSEDNHFTAKDVFDALQAFEDRGLVTYPINSIANRSGLHIEKNKRNGRKQSTHLKIARSNLAIYNEEEGRARQGRPSSQAIVEDWYHDHPGQLMADCVRATGLSRPTVAKWWPAKKGRCDNV